MIGTYSFVAITATDLSSAKRFWVDGFGFQEMEGDNRYFIVDAGGLRLSVDLADGTVHVPGGTDPVIGFEVPSMDEAIRDLASRGLEPESGPSPRGDRSVTLYRDPDGRIVLIEGI